MKARQNWIFFVTVRLRSQAKELIANLNHLLFSAKHDSFHAWMMRNLDLPKESYRLRPPSDREGLAYEAPLGNITMSYVKGH